MADPGSGQAGAGGDRPQPLFQTVRRGYDPAQVVDHLGRLHNQIRALESDLQDARAQLDDVRRRQSPTRPYEEVSDRVAELVRTFDEEVEKLRAQANAEIDRMMGEARAEAERIRREARTDADSARERAEHDLVDLTARRGSALEGVKAVRDRLLSAAHDLEMAIASAAASDAGEEAGDAGSADRAGTVPRPAAIPDPPPGPRQG